MPRLFVWNNGDAGRQNLSAESASEQKQAKQEVVGSMLSENEFPEPLWNHGSLCVAHQTTTLQYKKHQIRLGWFICYPGVSTRFPGP